MGSWRERWIARRNRWLANPAFHRAALDFPLTRPIALARIEGLFDLVAGFVYAQVLDAVLRLGLLEALRAGPRSLDALAATAGARTETLAPLLQASAALGLTEPLPDGRVALGPQGAALLGSPGLKDMVLHHRHLYADLADAPALFKGEADRGQLAAFWPYAGMNEAGAASAATVAPYSALMAASLPALAEDLLDAVSLRGRRRLMDVGGGAGVFLSAAARRWPSLSLRLFDLPAVAESAAARLASQGLGDRIECVGGDFLRDPLPEGADVISLVRILHDHDEAGVARLLASARAALPPDGLLIVAEPMAGEGRPNRIADAYFAVYLLAMGRGRPRAPTRLEMMLRQAGFSRTRRARTRAPGLMRVVLAYP